MQGICEKVVGHSKGIPENILKLMQYAPTGFTFNSPQAGWCVNRLFITLCLSDSDINSLCHCAIEAQKEWVKAMDVSIFYMTGHVHPNMVAPPPITIQVLPGATEEEVLNAFKKEKRRLIENAKKEAQSCYDRKTFLEKELEDKVWDLRNKVLHQEHEPGSPEHALKHVIEKAREIQVVTNEEDEEELVDEKSLEVLAFVEACEKALLIIIP